MSIPPPPLNGGLYTGEPFHENAPWRAFPVTPCTAYLNHVNLKTALPPTQALYQVGANVRPGNNDSDQQCGVQGTLKYEGTNTQGPYSSIMCMPCMKEKPCSQAQPTCKVQYISID